MPQSMLLSNTSSLFIFSLLSFFFLIHDVRALGVQITTPAPGATFPPGPFNVSWQDAGGIVDMSQLDTYTLQLVVGGNSPSTYQILQTIGSSSSGRVADGGVQGEISADIAQSIQNGFYLMMLSNTTKSQSTVINYSDRFTLINLNGTTDSDIVAAANAAAGDSKNVPEAQLETILSPTTTATSAMPTASSTTSTPIASSTTAPVTPASTHQINNDGLSSTAIAGLVVGAVLASIGVISVVIWVLFFYKRIARKRQERKAGAIGMKEVGFGDGDGELAFLDGKAELPAQSASSPAELHGDLTPVSKRFEVPGWSEPVEAPSPDIVYELEGDLSIWEAGSGRRSQAYDPTR